MQNIKQVKIISSLINKFFLFKKIYFDNFYQMCHYNPVFNKIIFCKIKLVYFNIFKYKKFYFLLIILVMAF